MDRKSEILDVHRHRFACKQYDPDRIISEDDFRFILETARLSPSSFGWEPWRFLVIQNTSLRAELKNVAWGAQTHLDTASHFVMLMARRSVDTNAGSDYLKYIAQDIQKHPPEIVDRKLDRYKNFQEDDFDLTDDRKLFDWASKQLYIPLGNMMTAAAQIGIDSCPIEGFDRAKVEAVIKDAGVIDTDRFGLTVMVSFGYRAADVEVSPKTRQSYEDVVEWVR